MEVVGIIKQIGQTQKVGANGFRKRDLVLTTDEKYPQDLLIQFVQDKCDYLDKFSLGSKVKIKINLRGREWTSPDGELKYFNTIQGWFMEELEATPSAVKEDTNDLPF